MTDKNKDELSKFLEKMLEHTEDLKRSRKIWGDMMEKMEETIEEVVKPVLPPSIERLEKMPTKQRTGVIKRIIKPCPICGEYHPEPPEEKHKKETTK